MKVKGIINVDKSNLAAVRGGKTCGDTAGGDILVCLSVAAAAPVQVSQQNQLETIVVVEKKDS